MKNFKKDTTTRKSLKFIYPLVFFTLTPQIFAGVFAVYITTVVKNRSIFHNNIITLSISASMLFAISFVSFVTLANLIRSEQGKNIEDLSKRTNSLELLYTYQGLRSSLANLFQLLRESKDELDKTNVDNLICDDEISGKNAIIKLKQAIDEAVLSMERAKYIHNCSKKNLIKTIVELTPEIDKLTMSMNENLQNVPQKLKHTNEHLTILKQSLNELQNDSTYILYSSVANVKHKSKSHKKTENKGTVAQEKCSIKQSSSDSTISSDSQISAELSIIENRKPNGRKRRNSISAGISNSISKSVHRSQSVECPSTSRNSEGKSKFDLWKERCKTYFPSL